MGETGLYKDPRIGAGERESVLRVAREVSATLGNDFFESLVKHVADALVADCVYIGELTTGAVDRIRTLAVCLNGAMTQNFEQDLRGSACAHVLAAGSFVYIAEVTQLFPDDPVLERLQAEAYVGHRLRDSSGQVLGVLAAIYRRRLHQLADADLVKSVLEVFTQRAAAELERKREYETLRRAEERHRAFIASNIDAMYRIEFEQPIPVSLPEEEQIERIYRYGYVAECNDAFARLIGRQSANELIGSRFDAIVPRSDTRLRDELRSAIRSGYRKSFFETTPLDAEGRRMYRLRSQFGIVENGALQRFWGTTRDITDLRRTQRALEASERRCREMIECLQVPAVVADLSGRILFANHALLRLGGWKKEELAAGNWLDLFADSESRDQWKAALLYAGSGPTSAHFETRIRGADGNPRLVSWDSTLLLDTEGHVRGIGAIGTDITSQKALEAQILQAQKLEGIARMAAAVGHDFKNLLTVVLGHTSNLLDGVAESHAMYGSLSATLAAATQCALLSEQLLAVGGEQRLHPAILNLNSIVADAEAVLRALVGGNIELELRLEPALRPVNADRAGIERVLTNLAANARDAMPDGGRLVITTANVDLDKASVPATANLKPGPYVQITLADTGIGMGEEVQTRIFDPFYTTKPPGQGTGLGLSTVYGIVRQSGGSISVQSRPGEGAVFTMLLPAAPR
jgi:PAS domain S-box-containing protein